MDDWAMEGAVITQRRSQWSFLTRSEFVEEGREGGRGEGEDMTDGTFEYIVFHFSVSLLL